jgi:mannose/fructose/N-acetylgalactosamine-specific phosphotransferase system component IID/mannose/fructose/N-acetylgalactosamine-specific phosphotransferase system component IIC
MQINALQAILIGLYYWFSQIRWGYGPTWQRPLFAGMIVGFILNDLSTGIRIGALIQPMFLAFTAAGGTIVWDQTAGTIAGAAVTMIGGLPVDQAITVALPVSLLFAQIHTLRRIWFAYPATQADKAAEHGNDRAIIFYGSYFCWLSGLVLYLLPMTLAMMYGAEAIGTLMANLPQWLINTLTATGGILPALGFAMTIRVIGRPIFLPFFLGGFFLVQYTGIGGMFLAMIGLFFAFLYFLILDAVKGSDENLADHSAAGAAALDENTKRLLTIKDCDRMFRRWFFYCEQSNSFSRLQSIAFCISFIPAMKKLYGNDPDEYSMALQRHLMFFNTQGIWGAVIHGIVLAMEEQRAMGAPIDAAAITGIKSGLMGPFAGIGDTIDWSTLFPLFTILVLPLAEAGNIMGPILQFVLVTATLFIEGTIFSRTGFRLGTRAALNILQGSAINTFISVASVLGLFMMGGLSASMVKVVTPIYIPTTGNPVRIQTDVLNKVAPGILPLVTVLGTYRFLQRGNSMTRATFVLLIIGLVLGAIGIIGAGGLVFGEAPAA